MDFVFDKLESANCAQCGGLVDVAERVAFSKVVCSNCKTPMLVPGKLGTLLLLEVVGTGAAGIVYKALDSTLHRHVAVKILKNDEGESSEGESNKKIVEATVAEARALAAINHPNVVHIHTIGMRHGQPYIVMELLIGSGKLNVMLKEGWVADEKRGLEIAIDVAQGLRAAQGAGLLHRDVKPGNILFNSEGVAKLLDFSVVHASTGDGEKLVIGTPYYISPESARGLDVDFRTDLYSLGATVFHLMTGRPVFEGESARDVVRARLKQRAPDIRKLQPSITAATAAVLARMLATVPQERQESYDELITQLKAALEALVSGQVALPVNNELADLHDALSGTGTVASASTVPVAMSKRSHSAAAAPAKKGMSPAMIGLAVAAGLALVVGILIAVLGGGGDKDKGPLASNTDPRRQRVDPAGGSGDGSGDGTNGYSSAPQTSDPSTDPKDGTESKDGQGDEKKVPDPAPVPMPDPDPAPKPDPEPVKPPPVNPQPQPAPQVNFDQALKAWTTQVTAQVKQPATNWQVMKPTGIGSAHSSKLAPQADGSVLVSGPNDAIEVLLIESTAIKVKLTDITAIRVEALPHDSLPSKGPGRAPNGNFVLSHLTAILRRNSEKEPTPSPENVYLFGAADADFSQDKYPAIEAIDNNLQTGWAILPRFGEATSAIFFVNKVPALASENDVTLRIMLHHQSGAGQHTLGHFRVSVTSDKNPFLPLNLPGNIEAIVRLGKRTPEQNKELESYFRRTKVEGLDYVPPGGLAQGPDKANPKPEVKPPEPVGPPPPKLDAYEPVELSTLRDHKLYDAEPDAMVFIPRYGKWHYWASAQAPEANWTAANFVATGWKLDDASFGYAYDNLRTKLNEMKGDYASLYIRAPFKVADPAKLKDVLLQGRFDDAIAVYLNGQLVYRSENLTGEGVSAKITSPTTRATSASLELKDAKKHLKAGVNIIAIECHNNSADDIDFIVDPALIATPMPQPRKPVAGNKHDNWSAKDAKLFTDSAGLIVDGDKKAPSIENSTTKTDFDTRSYPVRVILRMQSTASGQVKVSAKSKPKNVNNSVTDDATQNVPASPRMLEISFDVKVTGKLQALTVHLPEGESIIGSIRIINRRDGKVLEEWDFSK